MSGPSQTSAIKVIIPVMGPTGAGKSTFVNALIGQNKMKVGHYLTSCTSEPTQVHIPNFRIPGLDMSHELFVVDTPGFDDTNERDVVILTRIAEYLKEIYTDKSCILGGVVYIHDISQKRFTGTAGRNFTMFNHICGNVALRSVVLCTTNWSSLGVERYSSEKQREEEFRSIHWKRIIEQGSVVARFYRTQESAQHVITQATQYMVDQRQRGLALEIQEELVIEKKDIPETKAGKELRYTLREIIAMQKRVAELERGMARSGDADARARHEEMQDNIKKMSYQVTQLKIPLSRKLRRFFGF